MTRNELTTTILPNGLTVLAREMHHAPVASFWLWYRVGSRNEVPGITGISHWVEHMLFKGTPNFPKGEIDRLIARDGGVSNGMTWLDWTTYFETLPADRFDLALHIEADRMINSLFVPNEVTAERTVIISEREGNENFPQFLLSENVQATAFQVHPYHFEVIGAKCDLQAMVRDDLWKHYRSYYAPNNAVAVAVGDFDTPKLLRRIEELFGGIPSGPALPVVRSVEPPQRGERRVRVDGDGATTYVQVVFHAPEAKHLDFFPMTVLDTILGGAKPMSLFGGSAPTNKSSRLYRALVETELATSVGSSVEATVDPFLFGISATVRSGRTAAEVEEVIWHEVDRIVAEPVSHDELIKAIKQARAQFAYSTESVTSQGYWLGFASMVASPDWLAGFLDSLERVTIDDVQRVARQYLTRANVTVGWYIPKEQAS
jgi:zinc protease